MSSQMQSTLRAELVDITALDVDAIVNAANSQLIPGGGVCGAIHRAAGYRLASACRPLSPCPTGDARITPGLDLKARFVIHAVGPVWQGGLKNEEALLASTYRRSLELAQQENLSSMAFPAISTGIYGFPTELATKIAVETVKSSLNESSTVSAVVFACFSQQVLDFYRQAGVPCQAGKA